MVKKPSSCPQDHPRRYSGIFFSLLLALKTPETFGIPDDDDAWRTFYTCVYLFKELRHHPPLVAIEVLNECGYEFIPFIRDHHRKWVTCLLARIDTDDIPPPIDVEVFKACIQSPIDTDNIPNHENLADDDPPSDNSDYNYGAHDKSTVPCVNQLADDDPPHLSRLLSLGEYNIIHPSQVFTLGECIIEKQIFVLGECNIDCPDPFISIKQFAIFDKDDPFISIQQFTIFDKDDPTNFSLFNLLLFFILFSVIARLTSSRSGECVV